MAELRPINRALLLTTPGDRSRVSRHISHMLPAPRGSLLKAVPPTGSKQYLPPLRHNAAPPTACSKSDPAASAAAASATCSGARADDAVASQLTSEATQQSGTGASGAVAGLASDNSELPQLQSASSLTDSKRAGLTSRKVSWADMGTLTPAAEAAASAEALCAEYQASKRAREGDCDSSTLAIYASPSSNRAAGTAEPVPVVATPVLSGHRSDCSMLSVTDKDAARAAVPRRCNTLT